ncbi:hypothetical protein GCM10027416_08250 [Okibacterium endophyticum]
MIAVVIAVWFSVGPGTATSGSGPAGGPADASATAPPAPTSTVAAAPGDLTEEDAEQTLAVFLTALSTADVTADDLTALSGVAGEAMLEEIRAERLELEVNGWTIEGESVLESVTITGVDDGAVPPTVTALACVDSSTVTILDHGGNPISADGPSSPRALNLFTLTFEDSLWKVTARTFPDDPTC